MPWLTTEQFSGLTLAPAGYVSAVELAEPGWTQRRLDHWEERISSVLRKRYAVPFATPVPLTVVGWLEAIVTGEVLLKRGIDPTDRQADNLLERGTKAWEQVRDAAESKEGLTELPLRADTGASGVSKGAPLGYSEVSPYTWTTVQRDAAQDE